MPSVPYDSCNYKLFWKNRNYEDQSERLAINKFLKQIHSRDSIIDIGGGYGRLANLYIPEFRKCFIVDPSESLLSEARKSLITLKSPNSLTFLKTNSDSLPKDQFEVALMIRVAHHLPDPLPTFKEVYRVLKPQGSFILEYANKIHLLARLRGVDKSLEPIDVRSEKSKTEGKIIFVNHHPKRIEELLKESGFVVIDRLSVSNFRYPLIKKLVPEKLLLFFENLLQKPLAKVNFGPSIFLLCQKTK
ncbi:hypothetical protein COT44_02420 [Candidatus Shapirobacteria bacterium CG08_land_8_20_14_0_20_39_18]|uniref:Methyltransferase type 11 domain-containing protein n=1 Tax=Candidatus Shapirobacteria bacterium CG08_land_8_20_14_0_20_39_18 TaxID=1974883 RepID=A0A2M6XD69_9BACT|nr:MAG: hypothetical protein COT44_02420 [Candidatus Shapirobacteria bacterium CG08_land_8_20_14_0_20_39_18]PIY66161.1 MAG: hypothetical protein COY91_01690 [Candidatus Shapirobacteria bacterium CG_4_10_14_0_8_um_filter_39_15]PJE68863.1 MAG: hypothetical protein COU94_00160 [Candidatus Shapirobacteria bacterium CG10_big_fil_rev_8_21_14_0_10_38_8]